MFLNIQKQGGCLKPIFSRLVCGGKVACNNTLKQLASRHPPNTTMNQPPPNQHAAAAAAPPGRRRLVRVAHSFATSTRLASVHRPRTPEEHDVDFIVVKPGVAGIHAVGPALLGALTDHGATIDEALTALHGVLVTGPRKVYAASEAEMGLVEGQPAEFTVFSTSETRIPKSASRAPNTLCTPDTAHMLGQVVGVVTTRGSHWN